MGPKPTKVIEIYNVNLTLLAFVQTKSTNKISLKYEDIIMRTVDLSPLYRSFIGFDHLASLMDAAARTDKQPSFPPYNIEALDKDKYRITMAVAGFSDSELTIESVLKLINKIMLNVSSFTKALQSVTLSVSSN